ncbi:ATP-dependent Clp protease adaptor protein ClpS [Hypnocyclicus thermotrophus]|uniref:ATP-dependent Clp protease adapter protein ClpS n=1 Tax=Hypnocyclicus thermotrophus TaxID=1627895 RepID=A0AA46DXK1_9FUSO|nr:ATP-dependent Clp protease adaptor ClpS [Hypnocyclicus thermotrophus]TDT67435.1 ATP-dependent Clp protease adaptor protein ClpS [Hypnocyclicus thermotrophus]
MSLKEKIIEKNNIKFKEPNMYNVIFFNDDYTTMEFVVEILMRVFHKSLDEANNLMLLVHNQGKAIIGKYTYDIAITKVSVTKKLAKQNGFPLRVDIEKEDK